MCNQTAEIRTRITWGHKNNPSRNPQQQKARTHILYGQININRIGQAPMQPPGITDGAGGVLAPVQGRANFSSGSEGSGMRDE